jgi:hypothetical protein
MSHGKDVNCFDKYIKNLCVVKYCTCFPPPTLPQRESVGVLADFSSFTLNRFLSVKILPSKDLINMTQTDVLSTDVLSPRTFCPHRRFVRRTFCPTDLLSPRTFCPTDVLSLRTFCPHGRFVATDVLSTDVLSPDILSPDVLSGHHCFLSRMKYYFFKMSSLTFVYVLSKNIF